jgi:Skp family chaperone for outer membrane proteins
MCCKKTAKIAVVDVQRVVSQSRPVAELRQDVQAQMGSLQQWIEASNTEINNEKSPEEKEALTKQRQEELMQKQQLIQSDYAEKLQKLDADLTATIEKTAKAEGFNITLVKGSVATGGTDITEKVIENLTK